ncbi:MAG TPA: L-glutamate gamma-semialdehyde dehydrogenase [Chloroflexota bacterium]|nr:L-glutamate gamma-semialdehyde dehydrogenase [Chloroflexota bacterium]
MLTPFRNEPLTDFSQPAERAAFQAALRRVADHFDAEYPLLIGGEPVYSGEWINSFDPCQHDRRVGRVARGTRALAERALSAAWDAYLDWARTAPAARARILWQAAALLRRRKHEFSALMVYEVAKTWAEADADTAEAIDFLEYYGREMVRLAVPPALPPVAGEENEQVYEPLGAGVVIPPWNFPLAITTGMTAAAIVAGNTVVLKPASLSPLVAARLVALLTEAGLPPGVVNYLPGPGAEVGDLLVEHPRTRFVSFTGSREVGVHIYERAARVGSGQRWLKRVVAEMGGKNAIVVDTTADLEAAAAGIVASAYGFQGQKCSACSRVVALAEVHDRLLEQVAERTWALRVGPAADPETNVAALVDRGQYEKVLDYIGVGRGEGRLVCGGEPGDPAGYYVQPTVFADVRSDARIAQEEIFGPVVAFLRAPSYERAIGLANDTMYGLTGAVYSRDRAHLEYARREFHVGNLYFNRKCTGALVGAQPFGGFDMSGTDAKAGGPEHLLQFLQPKVIAERF